MKGRFGQLSDQLTLSNPPPALQSSSKLVRKLDSAQPHFTAQSLEDWVKRAPSVKKFIADLMNVPIDRTDFYPSAAAYLNDRFSRVSGFENFSRPMAGEFVEKRDPIFVQYKSKKIVPSPRFGGVAPPKVAGSQAQ